MTPEQPRSRPVLVVAGVALVAILLLIFWLGGALLPLIISGVLAYVLLPVVKRLERIIPGRDRKPGLVRLLAVSLVFLVLLGSFAGVGVVVAPPAVAQGTEFIQTLPILTENIQASLRELNATYSDRVPLRMRQAIRRAIISGVKSLSDGAQGALLRTVQVVANALTLIIGLAAMPVVLFYLLKDREELAEGLHRVFPPSIRPHAIKILDILNNTVGSYIRGQLVLSAVVGGITMIGLFLIGVKFPIMLGLVAGLTEMIPIIGPWMGGLVGVLVTVATMPEKAPWVLLFYLGVQLAENTLLVPRIQGRALGLHPIVIMIIIVIGSQLLGLWGIILGPPLVAGAKEVIRYFYTEWNLPPMAPAAATPIPPEASAEAAGEGEATASLPDEAKE